MRQNLFYPLVSIWVVHLLVPCLHEVLNGGSVIIYSSVCPSPCFVAKITWSIVVSMLQIIRIL